MIKTETMELVIETTEQLLGACPKNKEVYKQFIQSKAPPTSGEDESVNVQEEEEKGWTGFLCDDKGIFLYDHVMRGFLKEAATALKSQHGVKNIKSKIARTLFVFPRKLYITRHGKTLKEPEGVNERTLRAETRQGPRIALVRSDFVEPGILIHLSIQILANDQGIDKEFVRTLLEYGKFQGLGQFRNGSFGRFGFSEVRTVLAKTKKLAAQIVSYGKAK